MIIVSGHLRVSPDRRAAFLAASREAIVKARATDGCRDFVVAGDPIEQDRVNVYEEWETEAALRSFRGDGPTGDLAADILEVHVSQHVLDLT